LSSERPHLWWVLADALFADGAAQSFQLFIGGRAAEPLPDFLHGKDRELVAVVPQPDGDVILYDGLIDPDLAVQVLHLVSPGTAVDVPRPIVLEHSNSSLVFDERLILKVLRRVEPGPNPDVEITRVLAANGYPHVLAPLAQLRRDELDLAVLREFVVGGTEGWVIAQASVRDLLACGLPPEDCGGDFAPAACRLGTVLGGLHVALADAFGRRPGDGPGWSQAMIDHLYGIPGLERELARVGLDIDRIAERFHVLRELTDAGAQIHIHGDLHLAQVLLADASWLVLDFEGEPARRRDDRFTDSSPLRDLAGLLRSLHYAVATGLAEWGDVDDDRRQFALAWEQRNRSAVLDGYLGVAGALDLLPSGGGARGDVLEAFELDKAIYEVGYELRHRPDLVDIPLSGVVRLMGAASAL
jgi:maltokinase